jgi:hypothetical protein
MGARNGPWWPNPYSCRGIRRDKKRRMEKKKTKRRIRTTHFHLVLRSRIGGAIPPLPIRLHGMVLCKNMMMMTTDEVFCLLIS